MPDPVSRAANPGTEVEVSLPSSAVALGVSESRGTRPPRAA